MSFLCKPWSFAVRPPPTTRIIIARNVAMAGRDPAQERPGRPQRRLVVRRDARTSGPLPATVRTVNSRLLALYEAGRAAETGQIHVTIHRETWERVRTYWINNQCEDDGAWGYYKPMDGTGSMTCAGIASLVIAGDVLHEPDAKVSGRPDRRLAIEPLSEDQDRIDRGIDWLRRHFTVQANPPSPPSGSGLWHYYYLYGLERAGRLTARRKIGEYDWYREGASYLVQAIGTVVSRSSWKGSGHAEDNEDIATSLALLFLSKGRWPVLMAKVQYGSPAAARRAAAARTSIGTATATTSTT